MVRFVVSSRPHCRVSKIQIVTLCKFIRSGTPKQRPTVIAKSWWLAFNRSYPPTVIAQRAAAINSPANY